MNNQELNKKLISVFPILKEKYTEEILWNDGEEPGSHIVFEDIFVPFIRNMVHSDNRETLKTIFSFIEEVLTANNEYSNEVIAVSLLEPLIYDKEIENSFLVEHSNEKTRKIIQEFIANM